MERTADEEKLAERLQLLAAEVVEGELVLKELCEQDDDLVCERGARLTNLTERK